MFSMKLTCLLSLLVLIAQATGQKTTTKKTTTPKPIKCNSNKMNEPMSMCCEQPVGTVVSAEFLDMCSEDPSLHEWVNLYKWNTMLAADDSLNLNTEANKKLMCKVAPFINCLFKEYQMMFRGQFYGDAAMDVILKTNPNRGFYADFLTMLTDDRSYYENGLIPNKWNTTMKCLVGKKTRDVYMGNMFLTQYFLTNLNYNCQRTLQDSLCMYKWQRFFVCSATMEGILYDGQKVNIPQWVTDIKKQNEQKGAAFIAKYKGSI